MVTLILGWLKKVLWDEVYAQQILRGAVMALAVAMQTGVIDLGAFGWWGGLAGMIAAVTIRSGDRNPSHEELMRIVREEMARK